MATGETVVGKESVRVVVEKIPPPPELPSVLLEGIAVGARELYPDPISGDEVVGKEGELYPEPMSKEVVVGREGDICPDPLSAIVMSTGK